MVALTCGLRLSELLGLTWDAVDLDSTPPRLTVRRSLKRVPGLGLVLSETKTNRSRRVVHLTEAASDALRAHRVRQAADHAPGRRSMDPSATRCRPRLSQPMG